MMPPFQILSNSSFHCELLSSTTWCDMTYFLTAIGLTIGGSNTVHIYTQTIHRTTQLTNWEERGPCPRLCELYPGICLTIEEKYGKPSVRGSRRVPAGTMKTEYVTKVCCTKPASFVHPVHETATYRCDDTRGCVMQFWPSWWWAHVLETCRGMK